MGHVPVLAGTAVEYLRVRGDGIYVDCTAGAGGHAVLIAEQLDETGRLIAIDRDPQALELTRRRLEAFPQVEVVQGNYGDLTEVLRGLNVDQVDGVLIDAGVSSMQIDESARGFSFQSEGPLDMRMDTTQGPTAAEYLAMVDEAELARILKEYGDLRKARRIAASICERRAQKPLKTTTDLVEVVSSVFDFVKGTPDEVRTVFQAVRIAVNDELRWLSEGVRQAIDLLAPSGRIVCIAFHSGEDRIVKDAFRKAGRKQKILHPDGRVNKVLPAVLNVLTAKPVLATHEEITANPRAQSAKLRAAEKLALG